MEDVEMRNLTRSKMNALPSSKKQKRIISSMMMMFNDGLCLLTTLFPNHFLHHNSLRLVSSFTTGKERTALYLGK